MFGATDAVAAAVSLDVTSDQHRLAGFESTSVPTDWAVEELDARDLPPPHPLQQTVETLADLPPQTVLLQRNDRAPQHLFPKLDDRGYAYATVETDDEVRTAIWKPGSEDDEGSGTPSADGA